MLSIKSLKMKKVKDFFPSREAVREVRNSLEQKTEKDFRDFARSKQEVLSLQSRINTCLERKPCELRDAISE